ncbi:hypothetical protein DICVIV_08727 [Dictyocaulus viviparus]|uniref:Uncharacterized protein n=1 Tax=Dictyocaulus viviparus TaxID=29172 RepID=A0A0D8XNC8_DICVI|nr:hypothetical protein DICVIV_08727 [Dictyocaulus viviparus]
MVLNGFFGRTFTTSLSSNASIDQVVFQVEMLSGQINMLAHKIDEAVATVKERGQITATSLTSSFNNNTINNVKRMLKIVSAKTYDWPFGTFIAVGIAALVLILVSLLFLLAKGSKRIAEYSYKKKVFMDDHDIEGL